MRRIRAAAEGFPLTTGFDGAATVAGRAEAGKDRNADRVASGTAFSARGYRTPPAGSFRLGKF